MSEENAASVDPIDELDAKINEAIEETNEESAPLKGEAPEVEKPEAEAEEIDDGFQKRINKVTADKWEAVRKAEALEKKLKELESKPVELEKPNPDNFDYDEDYQEALIDYKVELKAKALEQKQQSSQQEIEANNRVEIFAENQRKFAKDKPDFEDVLNRVPTLQQSVLDEILVHDKGPETAYFLGTHLDIADQIVSLNPVAAAMKVGEIMRKLSEPKQFKPSSAPDPIEPISSGGKTSKERGPEGATFE